MTACVLRVQIKVAEEQAVTVEANNYPVSLEEPAHVEETSLREEVKGGGADEESEDTSSDLHR